MIAAVRSALTRTPMRLYAAGMVSANAIGAVIVFALARFILPLPAGSEEILSDRNYVAFFVYLPVAIGIGIALGLRVAAPLVRWLYTGGTPSDETAIAIVRLPLRQLGVHVLLWTLGVAVFVAVNASAGAALSIIVAIAVSFGGLATCSLGYLVAERTLRPITAAVMEVSAVTDAAALGVKLRVVLIWVLSTAIPILGLGLIGLGRLIDTVIPPDADLSPAMVSLSAIALVVGFGGMFLVGRSVSDPLQQVSSAMQRVEGGATDTRVDVYDASEIGRLQNGFNKMVVGLDERERLRSLFGRHVGHDVAQRALASAPRLGGENRTVAVLFIDLVGSTALAERESAEAVVDLLNRFFAVVVEHGERNGGFVNKFEGDAALLIFGAPVDHPDPATAALRTARTLAVALAADVEIGIGVTYGPVIAGNIGAESRFEYTVIGDTVNQAARLTDLAKDDSTTDVLTSSIVLDHATADEKAHWETRETVTLRGRSAPTTLAAPVLRS
ncbi:adenylate/guanylate cyclase domain-containing protein [Rhodococcus sp. 077-4]|uniref:adenylate/guanylate cyclase domain-containing protein n=1 Tax=Rhodococcus sp. 077-4 TaxID=2789271 RepID=UPI0039F5079B